MKRLQSLNQWSTTRRISALVMTIAAGVFATANAQPTLATLNSGPSSANVPTANTDPVLTVRYPREVVDPTIDANATTGGVQATLPANLTGSSLSVQGQGSTTVGVRLRSRAVLNAALGNGLSELRVVGTTGFAVGGEAAHSFICFLRSQDLAGIGTTVATLLTKVGTGNGAGDNSIPYAKYTLNNLGLADGGLVNASFGTGNGVGITAAALDLVNATVVSTGAGALNVNPVLAWRNGGFDTAIIVLNDIATAGAGGANLVTEYIYVRNPQQNVQVTSAASTVGGGGNITQLALVTNLQLIDDAGAANPADTTAVTTADLFIQPGGSGPVQSLATYLTTLSGPPVAGAITVTGSGSADFNRIVTVPLTTNILAADAAAVQASKIGFAGASQVFGISGENPDTNTASYKTLGAAADTTVTAAQLLQGNGPVVAQAASEIWMAITMSDTVSTTGAANQFQLKNAAGTVIATSNIVQLGLPTTGQVPGVNDSNLDGTTTDPLIATATNRVFVRFALADGNDAINSDGTWSDDGSSNFRNRKTRGAVTVARNPAAGSFVQSPLGGVLAATTNAAVTSIARPMAVAFETRANGSVAGISNAARTIVDQLAFVFDSTVTANNANRFAVGYIPATTITDLTAGLQANLNLRTAVTANAAAFTNQVLSLGGTTALATTNANNDTVVFPIPALPIVGTAADSTSTSIRPGTGFVTASPYFAALDQIAVSANGVGNIRTASATFTSNALTALTVTNGPVADGAPPAPITASSGLDTGTGNINGVTVGFSEPLRRSGVGSTQNFESESYFAINDKTTAANRIALRNATATSGFNFTNPNTEVGTGTNQIFVDLTNTAFQLDKAVTQGFEIRVFNPGFPLRDFATLPNENDPVVTRGLPIMITPPGVQFAPIGVPTGRATVNGSNNVITVQLKTTQRVDANSAAGLANVHNRFFVRGRNTAGNNGVGERIAGQFAPLTAASFATTAGADGFFTLNLTFASATPFTQETFNVEYVDRTSTTFTPQTTGWLVGFGGSQEVPGAIIPVDVVRAPTQSAGGNPLGMTIAGTVNLGTGADATATRVQAYVYQVVTGNGNISFVYKGVTYTGFLNAISGGVTQIADGATYYFHPQLKGVGGNPGTMNPQGVVNMVPDLDLSAFFTHTQQEPDASGSGSGGTVTTTRNEFVYKNVNSLANVVQPIALTVRRDPANPNRFTVSGLGVSNGTITLQGAFTSIGSAVVTGAADGAGARPFTLHTIGKKEWKGLPVVLTVCPDSFFAPGARNFLYNNLLHNRIEFMSDIDRTGAAAGPVVVTINSANVVEFKMNDYVNNDWVIFPFVTNNGGRDYAAPGANPANRVSQTLSPTNTQPINGLFNFPANTNALGAFVFLNSSCDPVLIEPDVALLIDDRGVYCGSLFGLNRLAAGYSVAVSWKAALTNLSWFNFGQRISSIGSGATTAFLRTSSVAANGGWNTVSNLRNSTVSANAFPASATGAAGVVITMNNKDGVRIGGASISTTPNFADLTSIPANTGVLSNQTQATLTQNAQ